MNFKKSFRIACYFMIALFLLACKNSDVESNDPEPPSTFELSSSTKGQMFSVTLTTEDQLPAPIGKYHNWMVLITDQQSDPVYPALISITGGMPSHGHGMPTQPRVTEYLGEGKYKLEGMKFNMGGNWRIQVHVVTDTSRDVAEFNFDVTY